MHLNDDDANRDRIHMVMIDHNHGRVFAYAVPREGVTGEAEWVPSRMTRDLDNMGYKATKVSIKSDQEPAMVALQEAIRKERQAHTISTNSPVGESECNGRAENAIRIVNDKTGILMAQLEDGIGEKVPQGFDIIPWMVRWAG